LIRRACKAVIENLEQRQLLSSYPAVSGVIADQDVKGNIQVSFPAETGAGITGYQVLRSVDSGTYTAVSGSPFAQGTGPVTFTDPAAGLTPGEAFSYEVIVQGTAASSSPPAVSNSVYYVGNTLVNHAAGFSGETDLTLSGGAVYTPIVTANGQLQMTTSANNEATAAYETAPTAINSDFEASYDFQLTNPAADGFAFVIQDQGTAAIGAAGGSLGYAGVSPSLAIFMNMYNGVTQTGLGINGVLRPANDMSPTLGNAFHTLNANNQTDVFQVGLSYQASTQTLFEAVRDTTTGRGYSTSYNLSGDGLVAESLLGADSSDYLGFSGGTGGADSQQSIIDWTFNDTSTARVAQQPQSVSANEDSNGNIQASFPAPSTGGVSGVTYQVLKSVNGGAYADVGSPIPASSADDYTLVDTGPFSIGSTYTYQAIISGTSPASPAVSNTVDYVSSSSLVNSVTSYHDNPASTGGDLAETLLTPATVSSKTGFGKLFSTLVDGHVYAQPLVEPGVNITAGNYQGTHSVAYVATANDSLYAIDTTTGQILWQDSFLLPEAALVTGGNSVAVTTVTATDVNSGNISPVLGVTGTPVIDPGTGYLYLVARTKQIVNGNTSSPHFVQTLYRVNIGSGAMASTVIGDTTYNTTSGAFTYNTGPYVIDPHGQGDGVVTATVNVNGTNQSEPLIYFNALRENNRAALAVHDGVVYIAFASDGDNGPYHGWVLGFDENSLASTAVFNANPDGSDTGIWQGGGTLTFDPQGYMYFETGNGTFDTTLNAQGFPQYGDYGDSVVKVAIDPSSTQTNQNINGWGLKVVDYFSPSNTLALASADEDLGSGGCMILPDSVGSAAHPHLMVACGKEGKIYLIDRDDMGHFSATTDNVVQEIAGGVAAGGSYDTPAFFNDGTNSWIYYGGTGDNVRAYMISNGTITTPATYTTANTFGVQGATLSISADGTNNGIVWGLDGGSNQLLAYNASNVSQQLYASGANAVRDSLGTAVEFTLPTIANGDVFVGTTNSLAVYGLYVPPSAAPPIPADLSATPVSNTQISLSWTETADGTSAPAGYYIDESTNGGSSWTQVGTAGAGAGASSYPVTGLQPGSTYDFEVDAFNSVGTSAFTNVVSATTTNLAASVNLPNGFASAASQLQINGNAQINGSDLELTDGNGGEASSAFTKGTMSVDGFNTSFQFQLTDAAADGFTFTLQDAANTAVGGGGGDLGYQGITPSVCVKFDLFNNAGEGTDSTGVFIDGDAPTLPSGDVPGEASVDMTSSGVSLTSGDPMLVNLNYDGTTLTEQVTDLTNSTVFTQSYALDIPSILGSSQAYVGFTAGTGGATAIQNIQSWTYTPTAGIPYAPTNFTVTPTSASELDLSWVDSLSTVTTYNVLELENGTYTQIAQAAGTATGYPVTGLLNTGGSYSFEVVAVNSAGSSPPAGPITGTLPVAPVDVTNFAFSNLTTGSVTLTWANDPSNATGIVLTRQLESDSSEYVTTLGPMVTMYTDSTLLPGRDYEYTIAARNVAGPSSGVNLFIQTVPAAPVGLTATGGPGEVALNWTPNGHAVSSYNIYRGTSPGGEGATPIAMGVTGPSFTDTPATGLVAGQTYYYTITAVDTGGESVHSAEVFATSSLAPAVSGVSPNTGTTTGGTPVTITGTNFTGASAVTFGGVVATAVLVNSAGTQITAVDPAGSAGQVDVQVTTPGGTSPTSSADQFTYVAPRTVVSVTTNDGEGDGNTTQASDVRQLVVTFSQAVNLTQPGAFSLGVYNLNGTGGAVSGNGANDGSITNISSVLNTATTTDGGLTWTITFAAATANTDASASLIDGIYSFSINNSDVMSNGVALTGSNTYTFHRLFGDVTGAGAVNNADARDFSNVYGAAAGSANYNAAFDFGGTGANINNTDARDFSLRYGQTFSSVLPAGGIN